MTASANDHVHSGDDHGHHHGHHDPGFIRTYIFSVDHKMIGKQFMFAAFFFMLMGGLLAMAIRWHLAFPKGDFPMGAALPTTMMQKAPAAMSEWEPGFELVFLFDAEYEGIGSFKEGQKATFVKWEKTEKVDAYKTEYIDARIKVDGKEVVVPGGDLKSTREFHSVKDGFYTTLFTMHGSVMIFLVIIPLLVGAFGNYVVPLQIGADDMAFPVLNMISFWTLVPGAIIMFLGTFAAYQGESAGPGAGWTSYPPLAVIDPAKSNGQFYWLVGVILLGTSSILGAVNYVTTICKLRAPGMGFFRMPLTVWSIFITSILVLFATPVLASAATMQIMDQTLHTSFFLPHNLVYSDKPVANTGGGQALLWQHLFWFYSHPAVYIMILPAMGIVSDVLSVFSRKPIFGYRPMVYAIAAIAGLGFIVWGHHMFMSGMNPALGTTFTLATIMIALPSAIKTFNWLGTLWGGNIQFTTAMLNAIGFVSMFVIGGLSGIFMASTPVDIHIHDTYFIVAHIHYVLFGGSMFGIFAGVYYWFPKMFGRMMNETLGKIHFLVTFIAFNMTFFPMHILGMGGMPRRYAGYDKFESLAHLHPVNVFISISAFLLFAGQLPFVVNFFWSLFAGRKAVRNPWLANTLEWEAPSPPPHGNFDKPLVVYRGPYEYSDPDVSDDYLPQTRRLPGTLADQASAPRAMPRGEMPTQPA